MALSFENVNYTYYSNTLGRAEVPDEATFNNYAFATKAFIQSLYDDGLILERAANGYDNAACMLIEEAYKADQAEAGSGNIDTSESIGSYSHSMSAKAAEIAVEINAKSADQKRYNWLKIYCHILGGVK